MAWTQVSGTSKTLLDEWGALLRQAYTLALRSPDPSTQNGALLLRTDHAYVISQGCNEFPANVEYREERWKRPDKYKYIEHAERNAILGAAKYGQRVEGSTMVAPWAACSDCARAIIQSGVHTLVRHQDASDKSPDFWLEEIVVADQMLHEAGVVVIDVKGKVCEDTHRIRFSGTLWSP